MSLKRQESISSFVDDELDAVDRDVLIDHLSDNNEQMRHFGRYCLISDAIKRNLPESPNHNLLQRVQVALASEPTLLAPAEKKPIEKDLPDAKVVTLPRRENKQSSFKPPVIGFSIAASVALVAVVGFQMFTESENLPQTSMVSSNIEPQTQQITLEAQPIAPAVTATLVATGELPSSNVSIGVENATYAEQSVIDDGEWTRITRIGDTPLRNHTIPTGAESHLLFNFQRNMFPLARSVNLDNTSFE